MVEIITTVDDEKPTEQVTIEATIVLSQNGGKLNIRLWC